jgi:hypothetical protein
VTGDTQKFIFLFFRPLLGVNISKGPTQLLSLFSKIGHTQQLIRIFTTNALFQANLHLQWFARLKTRMELGRNRPISRIGLRKNSGIVRKLKPTTIDKINIPLLSQVNAI